MKVMIQSRLENQSNILDSMDCMLWFNRIVDTLINEFNRRDVKATMKPYEQTTAKKYFKWGYGSQHFWLKQINEKGEVGDTNLLYVEFDFGDY